MPHLSLAIASLTVLLFAGVPATAQQPPGFERALKKQERRAEKQPENPTVLNDLGNLLALEGRIDEAVEAYRQALAADPDHAAARFNLSLALYDAGRARSARRQLSRLLKRHPDHAWGHYQSGVLFDRRGSIRRAIRHYTRAIVLDPSLMRPEVNPHILTNRLRLHAVVRAYHQAPPALVAPRVYENPSRIRKMLVPRLKGSKRSAPVEAEPEPEIPTEEVRPADG